MSSTSNAEAPGLGARLLAWARAQLEGFALAEISSRSLAIIRIFACVIIIHEFAWLLVSHRLDSHPLSMVLGWIVMLSLPFALVGFKTRWAFGLMAIAFGVIHLYYGFHLKDHALGKPIQIFQVMVLMTLTPSGRSLSVDRYLALREAEREGREPPDERMPWWQLELFLLQICVIYFWAAENKSDAAWLRGERMQRYYVEWYGTSDAFVYAPRAVYWGSVLSAWATTILEYALAFGLLLRRVRPWLWIGGIMLHLGIMFSLSVPFFTSLMFTMLFAALPPAWVHQLVEDLCE